MATRTIRKMLGNLPVGVVDVVRLFVEAVEEGGLVGATREELLVGYRRMVRMGVKAVEEAERTLAFGEVVRRSLEERKGRRRSTVNDLRSYAGRMVRCGDWAGRPLRGIGAEDCRELLQELFGHSAFAFRKGRSVLHSIFAFGMKQGWCDRNPVDAVAIPPVREQRVEPLQTEQIQRLMQSCDTPGMQGMKPAVSLMLWAGIRPGEVRRLRWGDIDTSDKVIYIDPSHSKTGGARIVPMRGPLSQLRRPADAGDADPVAPAAWGTLWRKVRERAGFLTWRADTLRHTFASMHLRSYADLPRLQAEMGHRDSSLLRTRYVNLRHLSAATAKNFWRGAIPNRQWENAARASVTMA